MLWCEEKGGGKEVARDFALNFLYDFARSLGRADQRHFIGAANFESLSPLRKIFGLPSIMANTGISVSFTIQSNATQHVISCILAVVSAGWGHLEINVSQSLLSIDHNFLLRYTMHHSIECELWLDKNNKRFDEYKLSCLSAKQKSKNSRGAESGTQQKEAAAASPRTPRTPRKVEANPVCVLNCGYVNGFISECISETGIKVATVEVSCRACGDDKCEFLVAPLDYVAAHVAFYLKHQAKRGEGSLNKTSSPSSSSSSSHVEKCIELLEIATRANLHEIGAFAKMFGKGM